MQISFSAEIRLFQSLFLSSNKRLAHTGKKLESTVKCLFRMNGRILFHKNPELVERRIS